MRHYFMAYNDSSVRTGEADTRWCEGLFRSGCICGRCHRVLPHVRHERVLLRRRPGGYLFNSISGAVSASFLMETGSPVGNRFREDGWVAIFPGGWIIRSDLLRLLGGPPISALGSVLLSGGERLGDFSVLTPERLLVRGGLRSELTGACPACGGVRYYPLPQPHHGGMWYLLRSSVATEQAIYDLGTGGLALRADVYERVVAQKHPGLLFQQLPLRDEPDDGLPAGLKPYLTSEEQAAMGSILWRDYGASQRRAIAARKGLEEAMEPYRRAQKSAVTMEDYYRIIYGDDSTQIQRLREHGEAHLPVPWKRE